MHAAAVFFSAPTLLFPQHRLGIFNFWGTLRGDSGSGFYARLFNASFEFEFVCFFGLLLDLGQKVVGAIPSWGVKKKGFPMGTYEEMGKRRNRMGWDISG